MYRDGEGTEVDNDESIKYFTLASSLNHVESTYNLGCIYRDVKI